MTSKEQSTVCFNFKPIDEKHLSQDVKQMLWNRFEWIDLFDLVLTNDDVNLYRMSWQKVWTLIDPQQSHKWRPDSKG